MILGDICTRSCRFCNVKTGSPQGIVDWDEPDRLADTIEGMNLRHVVLTSGGTVVYTHLTLPAKRIVEISVGGVTFKKKKREGA